jgi:hypothetical protein
MVTRIVLREHRNSVEKLLINAMEKKIKIIQQIQCNYKEKRVLLNAPLIFPVFPFA